MHNRDCGHTPWAFALATAACAVSPAAAEVVLDDTTGLARSLEGLD